MTWTRPAAACAALCLLGFASHLAGRATGVTPGVLSVPIDVTRAPPGCGATSPSPGCHAPAPGSFGPVQVLLGAATTSISANATIAGTLQVTGGVQVPPDKGGFCLETTGGTFLPGASTQNGRDLFLNPVPTVLTHTSNALRNFAFSFRAPFLPGPLDWFAAANTGNNDTQPTGDSWDWWQPSGRTGTPGIPFRLFVNAPGVASFGSACAGSEGLAPVIGSSTTPFAGSAGFAVEVRNVPPNAVVASVLGSNNTNLGGVPLPLDLVVAGAPGCFLRTNLIALQSAVASGGSQLPGGGSARVAWPIPPDNALRGGTLFFQYLVVDPPANAAGFTASAGLRVSIQ